MSMHMHIFVKTLWKCDDYNTSEKTVVEDMIATESKNDATDSVVELINQGVIIDPDQL